DDRAGDAEARAIDRAAIDRSTLEEGRDQRRQIGEIESRECLNGARERTGTDGLEKSEARVRPSDVASKDHRITRLTFAVFSITLVPSPASQSERRTFAFTLA